MRSFIAFIGLLGISMSSGALVLRQLDNLPPPVIPEPRIPPVVPEPRQAVPPVVPEPRQSSCQYSYNFPTIGQQVLLRSPSYPSSYPANSNCRYSFTSPAGSVIQINCNPFNVESATDCAYDKFKLSLSGNSALADASTICGQGYFTQNSTTNALTVGFTSDASNPSYASEAFRFSCTLTAVRSGSVAPAAPVTQAPAAVPSSASNSTCTCGFRNEAPRIVGGSQASVNEFPWRCNLYSPSMGAFCGATVISSQWILTAAHCTAAVTQNNAQGNLYVDCGDHDLTTTDETVNLVVKVSRIVQHPSYNKDSQDNDMSLLQLERPLTLGRTVQPACLPWNFAGRSMQGTSVVASGWGTTSSGGTQSMVLKKVDLPVLTTQECQRYYGTAVTNNMICTYSPGSDTCQGDSGGSIDYKDPNTGRYYAVGVVSWGVGCAGTNQPGVYAYVQNYLNWIQSTTGDNFCKA